MFELSPHLGQLISVQADLTILAARIVHVEDPLAMADAVGADGAAAGVEGSAVEEGAAEDRGRGRVR